MSNKTLLMRLVRFVFEKIGPLNVSMINFEGYFIKDLDEWYGRSFFCKETKKLNSFKFIDISFLQSNVWLRINFQLWANIHNNKCNFFDILTISHSTKYEYKNQIY